MNRLATLFALLVAGLMIGCAGHGLVPANSEKLSSGHGLVTATAPSSGKVYVVDHDNDKVVYSGRVRESDRIRVDSDANRIQVGDTTTESNLSHDHRYEIYFDKSS